MSIKARCIFALTITASSFLIIATISRADTDVSAELPVKVSAEADRLYAGIGDKIVYSLNVTAGKDTEIQFPLFQDELGGLTIKGFDSHQKKGLFGKRVITHRYTLSSYKPGPYTIPSAAVKSRGRGEEVWSEAQTEEIAIVIKSALEGEKAVLDVRDIKGPVQIRGVLYFLPFAAGALVLLAAIAGAYIFGRKKIKKLMTPPPKPPHLAAYEALERLNKSDLLRQGKIKEYYVRLSDIVRHYLEDRFDLRAPEMTTEEFLAKTKDTEGLSREDRNLLRDFMFHCDLVKFAKYGPDDTEVTLSSDSAKKLIDQTRPKEADGVPR
jgi:hypothetical protein